LRDELTDNGHVLTRLRNAIQESAAPHSALWDWILAIAEGFQADSYSDFATHRPEPQFPWELDNAVRLAFSMLTGVKRRAQEGSAAHSYYSHTGDDKSSREYLGYVSDLAREADRRVNEALDLFKRYQRLFPRPEEKL
jgi:hypothetical protein